MNIGVNHDMGKKRSTEVSFLWFWPPLRNVSLLLFFRLWVNPESHFWATCFCNLKFSCPHNSFSKISGLRYRLICLRTLGQCLESPSLRLFKGLCTRSFGGGVRAEVFGEVFKNANQHIKKDSTEYPLRCHPPPRILKKHLFREPVDHLQGSLGPKKSETSLPGPPGPKPPKRVCKKSRKSLEKVWKKSRKGPERLFRDFFQTLFGGFGPGGPERPL